ncbi:sigma-70 family RNA polymerase sigma factor [Pseudomonas koreensis]|uniref:sigma-70 family RNA polymerase sigma factor n=1 Tax=Pseudomonas koreensis TaxID=198620 RepID=UPI000D21D12A|nr:sigma-70 family RNA polymerase sigma factor [Pseudomonas koreensis]AVX87663.1 RNA polymerase subunit sigma [Pseudomonas koreensis]MBI6948954.1 sigma-70 family RNA polymerase sigma factor [Pseudomonas koreensis]
MSSAHPVESLYHDHHSWLTGWLRRRLGCPDSAADLAQDTFIRVLSAREPAAIIEPRAFLTTLAKRVLFNHYRRQDLERAYLESLAQMPEMVAPSEEDKAIILQTLIELDQLLDGLPRLVKRAFLLAQVDGLTYPQIAAELGISVATVKRHLQKAALRCYFAL